MGEIGHAPSRVGREPCRNFANRDSLTGLSATQVGRTTLTAMHPRQHLKCISALSSKSSTNVTLCRSEEHTSELQSRLHLVCRLLLEKKKHTPNMQSPQQPVCRLLVEKKERAAAA